MPLAVERESPLPSAGSRPGRPAARKRQAGATTAGFCIRLRMPQFHIATYGKLPATRVPLAQEAGRAAAQ
jgi:hypothetical protein